MDLSRLIDLLVGWFTD